MSTIDSIIKQLQDIKNIYGNLEVYDVYYGSEDYPKVELEEIKPTVIRTSLNPNKNIVIFD